MEVYNIIWRGIELNITYTPNWLGMADHIELRFDPRFSIPVSATGYRSHFIAVGSVAEYGGALAYVTDWLDCEAKRVGWNCAQMSLF
ncbi:hypothetical protein [Cribrihabitans neustonicus]|uniref:hypothetical protein n=1 Tax=Cribrihabitans neustonicus TaxID=1429085 RepID=UPI003B5A55E3